MAAHIRTLAARAIDAANEYCEEADAAAARPYSPIVSPPRTSPRLAARPVAFLPELCDDVVTDVLRFLGARDLFAVEAAHRDAAAAVAAVPEARWAELCGGRWPAIAARARGSAAFRDATRRGGPGGWRRLCGELGSRRCACCRAALWRHPLEFCADYDALAGCRARLGGDGWRHAPLGPSGRDSARGSRAAYAERGGFSSGEGGARVGGAEGRGRRPPPVGPPRAGASPGTAPGRP